MAPESSRQSNPATLSVCMIVKNEAALLKRCLESVRSVADEIVVVDTGSTDATIAVARECGAKVVESPWRDDFAYSRNISIEHATLQWILWLDADDVVPAESLGMLAELKKRPADRVYGFIVRNERPGNTGSEFTQARMFPRDKRLRFERSIHEQIMPSALRVGMSLEQQPVIIEHHGYADPATLRKKASRNITMLLQEYPRVAPDPVMAAEIADSCWLVDDLDRAYEWYSTVLTILEGQPAMPALQSHALYGIGNIRNRQEKYADAIACFTKASGLAPWRPDILYSMAVALELSGDSAGAVGALVRILPMAPSAGQVGVDFRAAKIKAYLRLIRLLIDAGLMSEAAGFVQKAVADAGGRPEIRNIAGKFHLKNGALIDALHEFEKSIAIHREGNLDAYLGLCAVYHIAGKGELVKRTLESLSADFSGLSRFKTARYVLLGDTSGEHAEIPDPEEIAALQREFFGMMPSVQKV